MSVDLYMSMWDGTPYMEGACAPGQGVDCVRLVVAWFNHLRGIEYTLPSEAQDSALHDPEVVVRVRRSLLQAYAPALDWKGTYEWKPKDCLAIGRAGNPYHVGIVADDGLSLWHAVKPEVCRTSIQAMQVDGFQIKGGFRCLL